jgi:glucokinase-like ROK family protein
MNKQQENRRPYGPGERRADSWQTRPLADSVFRLIWQEHRISRAEIAQIIGLSRSTVTEIIKDLLTTGFIKEVGSGQSRGGRRPILLEFQSQAGVFLGVDIGATHVSVVLTDLQGGILFWEERPHPVRTDPDGTWQLVFELCDESLRSWGGDPESLLSIGIAVPSPVDPLHTEWLSEVVIPGWHGRSDWERLQQRYGVPVFVDNDANLGALAEHKLGAGRGAENLIYIKLAHGIGAGYILRGEIYRGATGVAGEMGHLPIDPNGEPCVCGLRGCLVTRVGAEALEARAAALIQQYPDSRLNESGLTTTAIEDAALAEDELSLKLIQEAAEYLGIAITGWTNLMNPDVVILGGSMTRLGSLILEPIREKVRHCTLVQSVSKCEISMSELGQQAIAIGAATFAREEVFETPYFYKRASAEVQVVDRIID